MKAILCAALLMTAFAVTPGRAYEQLAYYLAVIGPEDLRNSRGTRLTDPGAVVQQDRANFHRFGIRHRGDEGDPVFGNRSMRAMIPGATQVFGAYRGEMRDLIRAGQPFRIGVFVCGTRGNVQDVYVLTPSIGDFSGCF